MDMRDICVLKMIGSHSDETRLVRGIAFAMGLRHPSMPKRIENPKIALLTMKFARWLLRQARNFMWTASAC